MVLRIITVRRRCSHPLRRPFRPPGRARVRETRCRQLRLNLASLLVVRKAFMSDQQIAMMERRSMISTMSTQVLWRVLGTFL